MKYTAWFVINISLYILCCKATLYKQPISLSSKELKDIFGELGCIEGFLMAVPISNTSVSSSEEILEDEKLDRFKNLTINAKSLKDKTPMCLVNELARHNKIQHQYRLTNEQGLPHKKKFSVTLKLGNEEYSAVGGSIKKGQHAAAAEALRKTKYTHPPPKFVNVNRANTTPCVELNTVAMKLGENPNYEFINYPKTSNKNSFSGDVYQSNKDFESHTSDYGTYDNVFLQNVNPTCQGFTGYYKIQLTMGKYGPYFGEGSTPQAARHAAAKLALQDIRQRNYIARSARRSGNGKGSLTNEEKSPISVVHEKGLKLNMLVNFEVVEEKGPPHMRVYKTECTVGPELIAVAEGLGKKESKKKAAEKMLELLNTIPTTHSDKKNARFGGKSTRRSNYKKRKNIVKDPIPKTEEVEENDIDEEEEEENAISRLHTYQQIKGAKEPVYVLVDERGGKEREYFIEVRIDQYKYTANAPGKKEAKRKAAEGMLEMLGIENTLKPRKVKQNKDNLQTELDKKVRESNKSNMVGRQIVPGLLLVPNANLTTSEERFYKPRNTVKNRTHNATDFKNSYSYNNNQAVRYPSFEVPSTSNVGTQDALVHTAGSLGYQVQFSDFPHRLTNNYLSMVSMNTNPHHVCYGEGLSLDVAREMASRRAFRMLDPYYRNDGHRLYGGMVNYSPYKMKL